MRQLQTSDLQGDNNHEKRQWKILEFPKEIIYSQKKKNPKKQTNKKKDK